VDHYTETNRALWDGWAEINYRAASYRTDEFRAGANKLHAIELEEVGDVHGKSLLHLQCHFGLDTLSWARMGAQVTGVDFSPKGIEIARGLSHELAIPADFICCDLYDLPNHLDKQFDIVFTSYGVLCWLPDLEGWAQLIARYLKPGGRFHIVEFHPFVYAFDPERSEQQLQPILPYFPVQEPQLWKEKGSYADREAEFSHDSYAWPHPVSEILNSLVTVGLQIEHFNEFPYCVDNFLPGFMHEGVDGWWRLNDHPDSLPLMFSLKAVKSR
jgi:SAM-dependent methyltransferase